MSRNWFPWRPSEVEYLAQNYQKIPTEKIARKLGRTPNSVIGKAYRTLVLEPAKNN